MDTEKFIEDYVDKLHKNLEKNKNIIIAYDFDDTVRPFGEFSKSYTNEVVDLLKKCNNLGVFKFILYTCREDKRLQEAIQFLDENNIPYDAINENILPVFEKHRKVYCNIMLDDKCGLPTSIEILSRLLEKLNK